MRSLRHAQVREYFFGHGEGTLAPSSQMADYGDLNIFRLSTGKLSMGLMGKWNNGHS